MIVKVKAKRKNPFDRVKKDEKYFLLRGAYVSSEIETRDIFDNHNIDYVNYFNDKAFANQVMLHQQLNRKLLKYAYDNDAEDWEWDGIALHHYIFFDIKNHTFKVDVDTRLRSQNVYFSKRKVAGQAIEDVIKPFMKEHPEFVW